MHERLPHMALLVTGPSEFYRLKWMTGLLKNSALCEGDGVGEERADEERERAIESDRAEGASWNDGRAGREGAGFELNTPRRHWGESHGRWFKRAPPCLVLPVKWALAVCRRRKIAVCGCAGMAILHWKLRETRCQWHPGVWHENPTTHFLYRASFF